MTNILLVSYYFAPENKMAAVRMSKIAKYLKISIPDTQIRIVTRDSHDVNADLLNSDDLFYYDKVYRFRSTTWFSIILENLLKFISNIYKFFRSRKLRRKTATIPGEVEKLKNVHGRSGFFFSTFYTLLELLSSKAFTKNVVKSGHWGEFSPDILISSFGPFSSHWIGARFKKRFPHAFWIADFRDSVAVPNINHFPFKKFLRNYPTKICSSADAIVGVSSGCLDNLPFNQDSRKYVIPNGFDPDDIKNINYNTSEVFTITYVGALYSGRRDLSPLFKVLSDLISEHKIDKNNICVKYAGVSRKQFIEQANNYRLLEIVDASDLIAKSESMRMQLQSNILLMATWNNVGDEGNLTGKFLEYMMMNRPIVALVSGDLGNSTVKMMIEKGNLGVTYEEANRLRDEEKLKEYINKQYKLYKAGKLLHFEPESTFIEQYNYGYLTRKIIDIIRDNSNLFSREGKI